MYHLFSLTVLYPCSIPLLVFVLFLIIMNFKHSYYGITYSAQLRTTLSRITTMVYSLISMQASELAESGTDFGPVHHICIMYVQ